jgi:hypothetical protein
MSRHMLLDIANAVQSNGEAGTRRLRGVRFRGADRALRALPGQTQGPEIDWHAVEQFLHELLGGGAR